MYFRITDEMVLRSLGAEDGAALATYFESLSPETKRRFQPHPLTVAAAHELCAAEPPATFRFVVELAGKIVGYFILETVLSVHEASRYGLLGIRLESGKDWLFAPSVADGFQNQGLASRAMPHLLNFAKQSGARSLVLMGGTHATNARAIAFYGKFGFKCFGGYQTEIYNHDMRRLLQD